MLLLYIILLICLSSFGATVPPSNCTSFHSQFRFVFSCQAKQLLTVPLDIPNNTQTLLLSFNHISSINQDSFSDLLHLQALTLGGQNTSGTFSVGKSAFHHLTNLIFLDLGGNRNISLHPQAFQGLSQLETLLLDSNGLDESVLESGMFKDLFSLKKLDLSFNWIRQVRPDPTFLKLSSISFLLLKHNKVQMLCGEDLQNLQRKKLELLDLSSNPLQFSATVNCTNPFKSITLETLVVSSMAWNADQVKDFLSTISGTQVHHIKMRHTASLGSGFGFFNLRDPNNKTFSGLNISNMQIFELSHSFISQLVANVFSAFTTLLSLDLSFNKIRQIDKGAFNGLNELVSLNLSGNLLGELMASSFQGLGTNNLKALDLSSNHIGAIQYNALDPFIALNSLNLRDNALKRIPPINLPGLTSVYLGQNRIADTYGLTSFCPNATLLDLSINRLSDLSNLWEILKLRSLKVLFLERNYISQCYQSHTSNTAYEHSLLYLDISDNSLGTIFKSGKCTDIFTRLKNLQYLKLTRNHIYNIPETIFEGLVSLHTLDLSGNVLGNIQNDLFSGLTALKNLNLARNSLVTLSPSVLGPLDSLKSVDLSEVTFVCDCSLMNFWKWLKKTQVIVQLGGQEVSCMKLNRTVQETSLATFVNSCQ
ncbi:hypothetical protein GDO86_008623 [Hymenochirus boettgeri]|uniref:Toll-like receptor 5 n=1 Tax=Hymenochirus boettgeri TaxID=247094 RepID=A0A8T2IYH4_9PIPI|nr:hypothetical protein GDO86_008623 [Hymenochirus boettgeri]